VHSLNRLSAPLLAGIPLFMAAGCGDPEVRQSSSSPQQDSVTGTPALDTDPTENPDTPIPAMTPTAAPATPKPTSIAPTEEPETPIELNIGDIARAGGFYTAGGVRFRIPIDSEDLKVAITINDPGGLLVVLYDLATKSSIKIDPETGNVERQVGDSKWSPVFDYITASVSLQ
jgi:hypothetical protein